MNPDLPWLQRDDVGPDCLKCWEPPQVRMENIHLAEDAGLLIGDPGWVEVNGVIWREEVPALPTHRKHHSQVWLSRKSRKGIQLFRGAQWCQCVDLFSHELRLFQNAEQNFDCTLTEHGKYICFSCDRARFDLHWPKVQHKIKRGRVMFLS